MTQDNFIGRVRKKIGLMEEIFGPQIQAFIIQDIAFKDVDTEEDWLRFNANYDTNVWPNALIFKGKVYASMA